MKKMLLSFSLFLPLTIVACSNNKSNHLNETQSNENNSKDSTQTLNEKQSDENNSKDSSQTLNETQSNENNSKDSSQTLNEKIYKIDLIKEVSDLENWIDNNLNPNSSTQLTDDQRLFTTYLNSDMENNTDKYKTHLNLIEDIKKMSQDLEKFKNKSEQEKKEILDRIQKFKKFFMDIQSNYFKSEQYMKDLENLKNKKTRT
ncbi:hypothetical protein [Mycoplasma tauri]|uniref:hypothetical protein n=1 Tax=Mycoplasma tauri TaxID=547987 RepID=UPI001CBE246D|nr:hypothetical protein [Mycoplasma tauri]MBZ4203428.1 hypothetical protein [Mycoplasma tauri]